LAVPRAQQNTGSIQAGGASPRIEKLKADLAVQPAGVVQRFWDEIARDHTPIVEPVPGDPSHVRITLVWRGRTGTSGVDGFGSAMTPVTGTDVWYQTFVMAADHRISYHFTPHTGREAEDVAQPDPLNPHRFVAPIPQERPASAVDHESGLMNNSIVVLPLAPASPFVDPRPGIAAGRVEERSLPTGTGAAPRRIWVYLPPLAAGRAPEGLLICSWAKDYLNAIPVPTILDNLIAEHRIPPIAAVFVDEAGDRFQNFQVAQRFADMIARDLIPFSRTTLHVPADSRRVIVTGYSAAGLEAALIGLRYPDLVGNVLSQSGAFWRGFEGEGATESEWMSAQFAIAPRRETKFYIDVGGAETTAAGGTFKAANLRLRDVLMRRGFSVVFNEVPGGEHEFVHWRTTIADGLIALTAGWPRS
jgi:enterochelin esterase family protein